MHIRTHTIKYAYSYTMLRTAHTLLLTGVHTNTRTTYIYVGLLDIIPAPGNVKPV